VTLSPDSIAIVEIGPVTLNATVVYTWIAMAVILLVAWLATRRLTSGTKISRWQNFLEAVVSLMRRQIREMTDQDPDRYLPFLGTLFLLISVSNLLDVVPGYTSPMGSLSAAAALALCVFFAVPVFGIARRGLLGYLKHYIRPTPFMAPFTIIGELSRTLALAVRLFGNIMSGTMIIGVLISIVPFFVPVVMQALSLLIGQIQAYIFAALATIYIASATRIQEERERKEGERQAVERSGRSAGGGAGPDGGQ
jgi:F-type H+-transporting ATPase subunit a